MDITNTNKGASGYSLYGIPGIFGEQGSNVYYSSIDSSPNIKTAIRNKKTLSNNQTIYNERTEYMVGDLVIDPVGNIYSIENVATGALNSVGTIALKKKIQNQNPEHIPPQAFKINVPSLGAGIGSRSITNFYNLVTTTIKSCLYRHIVDCNRQYHKGLLLRIDGTTQYTFYEGDISYSYTSYTFLNRMISVDSPYKDIKIVFLFGSGYSCEFYFDNATNFWRQGSAYMTIDNRYGYYEGVSDSVYDSSRFSDVNSPYNDYGSEMLRKLEFDSKKVEAYLEYFYKEKSYRVKIEYGVSS